MSRENLSTIRLEHGQQVDKIDRDIIGSPKESWTNVDTSSNQSKFVDIINSINDEINNIYKCGDVSPKIKQ